MTVKLVMGCPASGKGSFVKENFSDHVCLNRDSMGRSTKITALLPKLEKLLETDEKIVLDNTFPTAEVRKPFIDLCKNAEKEIECFFVKTSIEDAQVNALHRMWDRYGKIFYTVEEMKGLKDPNIFPPAALFSYRKVFEKPTTEEGFSKVTAISFKRRPAKYRNKAIILDYDGTLRETIDGSKYPMTPDNIKIMDNRHNALLNQIAKGYHLFGISNQSGVGKKKFTYEECVACFEKTNQLLRIDINYYFCPHKIPPAVCYCRKPQSGLGIFMVEKYGLDPARVIMVGDYTTDKTFAKRCGFQYVDQADFFK